MAKQSRLNNLETRAFAGDKREAILRAAIQVFAENGFFNSKVSDIAKKAGVADGTVYLYFKNKDDILRSIFDQAMALFIAEARKEIELLDDPKEKLRRIAELHLEKLGADRELAIVFQVELRGSTKFMEEFSNAAFAEYLNIIKETFIEGQQKGVFRSELNPTVCAKILFGALDEMVTNWILSKKNYALAPMAEIVTSVFFDGVLQR
ncbi:MAG: TetR/AcrR family transcriptional regulator [Acidobacteria bacterium]|jgi:TetR/AcrR family fatty acid metabolism transcriptional regulator|nr:MAG: TetR/AcrR family transcriptional regulator [Acidobacteriota bacterium]GIU83159.1 MAG: fatty acid metabolism regulator protein [Pyrinomonadaceae bacterium]